MENIRILHLSDLHINNEKLHDIKIVIDALLCDLKKLRNEEHLHVDFVCFTGDLIQKGEHAHGEDGQYDLAINYFINPLLCELSLANDGFFIVPGNHEVDQSRIDQISEHGLRSCLIDRDSINHFIDTINPKHIQRIIHFDHIEKHFQKDTAWSNLIGSAHIRHKGNFSIGFACLNSVWRAMGTGPEERGSLILGERQVDLAYQAIQHCNIKIALMHHPTYWLAEPDKIAVDRRLANFDIILNGHLHNLGEEQIIIPGHNSVRITSGSLFHGRTEYNGYSIIDINPFTKSVTCHFRKYSDNRRSFIPAESIAEGGFYTCHLDSSPNVLAIGYNLINNLKPNLISHANSALIVNAIDTLAPQDLSRIFVPPNLSNSSEYMKEEGKTIENISLEDVLNRNDNILFIGKKEIGKTTLLNYIAISYINRFTTESKIPFIVDLRYLTPGKDPVERAMVNYVWNVTDDHRTNKQEIIHFLESGNCVILFDNLESDNEKIRDILKAFTQKYNINRFIFVLNENVFETISLEKSLDLGCCYTKIYIQSLSRDRVRKLIENWFDDREVDIDQILNKVMYFLTYVGMPRTPFIVSMLLAIIDELHEYVPINEATLIERFLEIIFDKLSPTETKSSTYDFWNKSHYLSELAWHIVTANL